jgi:hypothetical protein
MFAIGTQVRLEKPAGLCAVGCEGIVRNVDAAGNLSVDIQCDQNCQPFSYPLTGYSPNYFSTNTKCTLPG